MPRASKLLKKWIIIFAFSHFGSYLVSCVQTGLIIREIRKRKEGEW